jgi:hypothetical protein
VAHSQCESLADAKLCDYWTQSVIARGQTKRQEVEHKDEHGEQPSRGYSVRNCWTPAS